MSQIFNVNLLSVVNLSIDNSCEIHFSSCKCFIQDPVMKRKMKIGDLEDGLFKLHTSTLLENVVSAAAINTQNCNVHLWHNRLGHPSSVVLSHIPQLSSVSTSIFSNCDVCHMAKQRKLSFTNSDTHSSSFELIHCDVWGPYKQPTHSRCHYFLTIVDDFTRCTRLFLFADKTQWPTLIKKSDLLE